MEKKKKKHWAYGFFRNIDLNEILSIRFQKLTCIKFLLKIKK